MMIIKWFSLTLAGMLACQTVARISKAFCCIISSATDTSVGIVSCCNPAAII